MTDRTPYSRVYWSVMSDDKFDGIRENPWHFGSWCLLLVVADMAWPAPAFQPPTVSRKSMRVLIDAGLVDQLSGGRFRIHGLDAERTRRAEAARVGGIASGRSRSVQPLFNGRSTETNLDETSTRRDEQYARERATQRDDAHQRNLDRTRRETQELRTVLEAEKPRAVS